MRRLFLVSDSRCRSCRSTPDRRTQIRINLQKGSRSAGAREAKRPSAPTGGRAGRQGRTATAAPASTPACFGLRFLGRPSADLALCTTALGVGKRTARSAAGPPDHVPSRSIPSHLLQRAFHANAPLRLPATLPHSIPSHPIPPRHQEQRAPRSWEARGLAGSGARQGGRGGDGETGGSGLGQKGRALPGAPCGRSPGRQSGAWGPGGSGAACLPKQPFGLSFGIV